MQAAFDLGTTTGWAVGRPGLIVSGFWNLKPRRFEGGGMRYLHFRKYLNELHASQALSRVAYEEVRRHVGTDAAHVYGGLLAELTSWCEENKIPYEGIPVGTIKKFATGKGNSVKEVVIAAVKSWGFPNLIDDNEADALALLHLKLAEAG